MSNHSLDLKGLRCPKLVLSVAKHLKNMNSNERIKIITDDPFAYVDLGSVFEIENREQKDGYEIINIVKR